jgi:hypothetical protein
MRVVGPLESYIVCWAFSRPINPLVFPFSYIMKIICTYSLRPKINAILIFQFCPIKNATLTSHL